MQMNVSITPAQVLTEIHMARAEFRNKLDVLVETLDELIPGVKEGYEYNIIKRASRDLHLGLNSQQAKGNLQMFTIVSQKIESLKNQAEGNDTLEAFIEGKKQAEKELDNVADKSDNNKGESA